MRRPLAIISALIAIWLAFSSLPESICFTVPFRVGMSPKSSFVALLAEIEQVCRAIFRLHWKCCLNVIVSRQKVVIYAMLAKVPNWLIVDLNNGLDLFWIRPGTKTCYLPSFINVKVNVSIAMKDSLQS